ncbi:MAG TPA: peptidase S8, partial [Chryseosolibacter sp.]|nr:peptidase S8 [Chryseosolibacter sp.]
MEDIKIVCGIVLLWIVSASAAAQENRYMVFFRDKAGTPYTTSKPIEFLSDKAIDRRLKQGIDIVERDLPVQPAYVDGVRNAGANTFFVTRWLNGVLIQCDPAVLPAVESLPYVNHIEFVAPLPKLQTGGRR